MRFQESQDRFKKEIIWRQLYHLRCVYLSMDIKCIFCMSNEHSLFLFFPKENIHVSPLMEVKDNKCDTEPYTTRLVTKSVKLEIDNSPIPKENERKDESKVMAAACSASKMHTLQAKCTQCKENPNSAVMGYTTAPAPNVYPAIDSSIQLYSGTPPAPTAFPTTTYQQGVCAK